MENDKISKLEKETIELLEKTKKQYTLYEKERKTLYTYFVNKKDLEEWEAYIQKVKKLINETI